jgi:hypothetical protein
MIEHPTVVVLGAGASMPYGFPPGSTLAREVVNAFAEENPNTELKRVARLNGFDDSLVKDFPSEFNKSPRSSLDAFVESRKQFRDIVKYGMAAKLLPREAPVWELRAVAMVERRRVAGVRRCADPKQNDFRGRLKLLKASPHH